MNTKSKAKVASNNEETELQFKVVRKVTLPVLKISINKPYFVKIDDKIFQGKKLDNDKKDNKEPAFLVNVTDLKSGEQGQIVLNKVLKETLLEEYPDESYVGLCFQIVKKPKDMGKDYHTFSLVEIELG